METIFKKAADPFQTLHEIMAAHERRYPESRIQAVENGVYVARKDDRYHLGISSGDGGQPLEVDVGYSLKWALLLARYVCENNPALKKVSLNNDPYIAVDPARIADVTTRGNDMLFQVAGTTHALCANYQDSHKAHIDCFLISNKISFGRMGHVLESPAPLSTAEKNKWQQHKDMPTPI